MYRRLIPGFLAFALITGCAMNKTERSDEVPPSHVYQTYSVEYDGTSDTTIVTAQMRAGSTFGPTLRLVGSSRIEHASVRLVEATTAGTSYTGTAVGWAPKHRFVFTDNDGKTYENTIDHRAIGIPAALRTARRSADLTVTWTGGALSANEAVELIIADGVGGEVRKEVRGPAARSITVAAAEMSLLRKGAVSAQVSRISIQMELAQQTQAGGMIRTRYAARPHSLTLND